MASPDKTPLEPSASLLVKLGSIVAHVEELFDGGGHAFDKAAVDGLLVDPEVRAWLDSMNALALLPVRRG